MSEPFLGEIKMFGGNFAPRGYAMCNGQQMSISQNTALFSILGTTFGGNGQVTFGLPDMRGRVPTHWGQGPGLSLVDLGEVGGVESVTMTVAQMPAHTHAAVFTGTASPITGGSTTVTIDVGTTVPPSPIANPTNGSTTYLTAATSTYGGDPVDFNGLYTSTAPAVGAKASLGGITVGATGGSGSVTPAGTVTVGVSGSNLPFEISQPYLGVTFIIALNGIFPSRN